MFLWIVRQKHLDCVLCYGEQGYVGIDSGRQRDCVTLGVGASNQ
jgi:hypothetical protein